MIDTVETPIPEYDAVLVLCPHQSGGYDASRVWFITHPLGGPARGTFTRVEFASGADTAHAAGVVRRIAHSLYGTAWSFIYGPEEAQRAVHKYGMNIREAVLVTGVYEEQP